MTSLTEKTRQRSAAHGPHALPGPRQTPRERIDRCPLCDSPSQRVWRRGFDRLHRVSDEMFTYVRCRDCDLIYLADRPAESNIADFYPEDYGPYHRNKASGAPCPSLPRRFLSLCNRACGSVQDRLDRVCTRRFWADYWRHYSPPRDGAVLLDFGCGSDKFLNRARKLGWDTIGIDFSPGTIEAIRAAGHRGYLADDDAWPEIAEDSIDFVRMSHVLEHLYRPRETLARLKQKMRLGATIHIAVPHPSSLASRLFRSRWHGLDCPRHIMLYTPQRARRLLADLGFNDVRIAQETAPKDIARSVAFLLADAGLIAPRSAGGFVQHYWLQLPIYLPMRVASALKLGDRFHVFAKA
jgi:hypothetical protein